MNQETLELHAAFSKQLINLSCLSSQIQTASLQAIMEGPGKAIFPDGATVWDMWVQLCNQFVPMVQRAAELKELLERAYEQQESGLIIPDGLH